MTSASPRCADERIASPAREGARRIGQPKGERKVWGPTLIVTPPTILGQWESELKKHSPDLKVDIT